MRPKTELQIGTHAFFDNNGNLGYRRIIKIENNIVHFTASCGCRKLTKPVEEVFATREEFNDYYYNTKRKEE